jgi:hypothetical protein
LVSDEASFASEVPCLSDLEVPGGQEDEASVDQIEKKRSELENVFRAGLTVRAQAVLAERQQETIEKGRLMRSRLRSLAPPRSHRCEKHRELDAIIRDELKANKVAAGEIRRRLSAEAESSIDQMSQHDIEKAGITDLQGLVR